jgi:hypothetical protein
MKTSFGRKGQVAFIRGKNSKRDISAFAAYNS